MSSGDNSMALMYRSAMDSSALLVDWTPEESKAFELALARHYHEPEDRWHKIASCVPGRTAQEAQFYFQQLEEDLQRIDRGLIPVPDYTAHEHSTGVSTTGRLPHPPGRHTGQSESSRQMPAPTAKRNKIESNSSSADRRKGVPWTEEEHKLFLVGLQKFGKGDWRSIARNYVVSRTPTQVASHAQKYFIRLNSANKRDKRRASIHDITSATQM